MAKTNFTSVTEYLASQPKAMQGVLKLVRSAIRKALPGSEEVISYSASAGVMTRPATAARRLGIEAEAGV